MCTNISRVLQSQGSVRIVLNFVRKSRFSRNAGLRFLGLMNSLSDLSVLPGHRNVYLSLTLSPALTSTVSALPSARIIRLCETKNLELPTSKTRRAGSYASSGTFHPYALPPTSCNIDLDLLRLSLFIHVWIRVSLCDEQVFKAMNGMYAGEEPKGAWKLIAFKLLNYWYEVSTTLWLISLSFSLNC